jgi:signal peptidase I
MSLGNKNVKLKVTLLNLLEKGISVDVTAQGLSMFPVLLPDDVLRVKPVKAGRLNRGRIIVYEVQAKVISHRFIKIKNGKVICKGDGLLYSDAPVEPGAVLGVVIARTRKNKTTYFNTKRSAIFGQIISYITPLTGFLFHYLGRAWYKCFFMGKA